VPGSGRDHGRSSAPTDATRPAAWAPVHPARSASRSEPPKLGPKSEPSIIGALHSFFGMTKLLGTTPRPPVRGEAGERHPPRAPNAADGAREWRLREGNAANPLGAPDSARILRVSLHQYGPGGVSTAGPSRRFSEVVFCSASSWIARSNTGNPADGETHRWLPERCPTRTRQCGSTSESKRRAARHSSQSSTAPGGGVPVPRGAELDGAPKVARVEGPTATTMVSAHEPNASTPCAVRIWLTDPWGIRRVNSLVVPVRLGRAIDRATLEGMEIDVVQLD
jgi:hypothetical protein